MDKIGDETKTEETGEGASELIFSHRGHMGDLADATWSSWKGQHYVASVDNLNLQLQVWKVASEMVSNEEYL